MSIYPIQIFYSKPICENERQSRTNKFSNVNEILNIIDICTYLFVNFRFSYENNFHLCIIRMLNKYQYELEYHFFLYLNNPAGNRKFFSYIGVVWKQIYFFQQSSFFGFLNNRNCHFQSSNFESKSQDQSVGVAVFRSPAGLLQLRNKLSIIHFVTFFVSIQKCQLPSALSTCPPCILGKTTLTFANNSKSCDTQKHTQILICYVLLF